MEFGYYIRPAETYEGMVEMAQYAEELGLYGVFLNDHVHSTSQKGMNPILEAWTAMAGISAQTKQVRLGQIVLFNSLRNPAFLNSTMRSSRNYNRRLARGASHDLARARFRILLDQ